MSAYYEFKLPTKILSGDGALEHIPQVGYFNRCHFKFLLKILDVYFIIF